MKTIIASLSAFTIALTLSACGGGGGGGSPSGASSATPAQGIATTAAVSVVTAK